MGSIRAQWSNRSMPTLLTLLDVLLSLHNPQKVFETFVRSLSTCVNVRGGTQLRPRRVKLELATMWLFGERNSRAKYENSIPNSEIVFRVNSKLRFSGVSVGFTLGINRILWAFGVHFHSFTVVAWNQRLVTPLSRSLATQPTASMSDHPTLNKSTTQPLIIWRRSRSAQHLLARGPRDLFLLILRISQSHHLTIISPSDLENGQPLFISEVAFLLQSEFVGNKAKYGAVSIFKPVNAIPPSNPVF